MWFAGVSLLVPTVAWLTGRRDYCGPRCDGASADGNVRLDINEPRLNGHQAAGSEPAAGGVRTD